VNPQLPESDKPPSSPTPSTDSSAKGSELARDSVGRGVAWIDGDYCAIEDAKISVLDWGLLRSDATYDVVHVWNGRFFRLDAHLERFTNSIEKLRLQLPVSTDELTGILASCVSRSGLDNAYVEMMLTRGTSPTFSRDPREAINNLVCFAIPFGWIANPEQRERGLHVSISDIQRIPPDSVDPSIKNYHWLDFVQALYKGYDGGHENVIMVDARGNITEGPGFNVFVVESGTVSTPSTGVLKGITRQTVIDLCNETGTSIEIAPVASNRVRTADEVFISSTAGGIMSVTRVDGAEIASGTPGPLTQRLTEAYWERHNDPEWSSAVNDLLPSG